MRYASSKRYREFWYCGTIDSVAHHQRLVWLHVCPYLRLSFYHSRMAMCIILFVRHKTFFKQYFALVGVFGSIMALIYPVFYPFPFPFMFRLRTMFSGHWALFG